MNLTQKQKIMVTLVMLVLAGLGGAYYKYGRPRLAEYKKAAADLDTADKALKAAQEKYFNRPNAADAINEIKAAVTPWEQELVRAKRIYNTTERKAPEGNEFLGYYWRDEFSKIQKEVVDKAANNPVPIPQTLLGFPPEVIPANEAVEMMLNYLENAKFVLGVLIDSGAMEISQFVVGERIL